MSAPLIFRKIQAYYFIMKKFLYFKSFYFLLICILAAGIFLFFQPFFQPLNGKSLPEAKSLRAWAKMKPSFPIVFTSRSEATSFSAAADSGDGFSFPGTIPWKAAEGRLRMLTPQGGVVELTWDRPLADGTTLIDVLSPTLSVDGKRILFAGRKALPDPGHWRIFEMDLTGETFRQITGGPEDPGCLAVPPMRFGSDGSLLSDSERRKIDYDDVDPVDLGPKGIAFVSSRLPDLGRDHARRATQVWRIPNSSEENTSAPEAVPISANRNNDRWPFLLSCDRLIFSSWSRVTEGVTFDRKQVKPFSEGGAFANHPYENWMASRLTPNGAEFGYAIKSAEPVWRPRPLFNGRIVYMTESPAEPGRTRIAQADWGYIRSSPSSLAYDTQFPDQGNAVRLWGPEKDEEGHELVCGCPSPAPGDAVLFSAAPKGQDKGAYALYQIRDDWSGADRSPQLLFDDPHLVDSEPVAVYARAIQFVDNDRAAVTTNRLKPESIAFASGAKFSGPMGYLENLAVLLPVRSPIPWNDAKAGSRVDPQINPLIPAPTMIKSIAFYGSRRDRFDDPQNPRIKGGLEGMAVETLREQGSLEHWVPSDPLVPTLLAGLDSEGKIATWQGKAKDASGKIATYLAYAGDHYSAAKPNGYHYCNGCHTGHTFLSLSARESKAK